MHSLRRSPHRRFVCLSILFAIAWWLNRAQAPAAPPGHDFHWESTDALIGPESGRADPCDAIKDPSVVFHDGSWHVFATIRSQRVTHQIEYLKFTDWKDAHQAHRHVLKLPDPYVAAPQVFYSRQLKRWCLLYQARDPQRQPGLQPVLLTNDRLDDPAGWRQRTMLWDRSWPNCPHAIDFWIICDRTHARLFFTSNNGKLWRSDTPLAQFPRGFDEPKLVLEGDFFEASCTYKLPGQAGYLTLIEAERHGQRRYMAWTADALDAAWKPVACTWERCFASRDNVDYAAGTRPWAENISHGELIRSGTDEMMEVDPARLQFLYQGARDDEIQGREYGKIPWRLGLLRLTSDSPLASTDRTSPLAVESTAAHARQLRPRKLIDFGGREWKDGQVNEPIILVNPKNPLQLIMFYSAMQLGGTGGAIGKAWADIGAPLEWHESPENPVFRRDSSFPFEQLSIRLDSVVYRADRDEYWIYYTGSSDQQRYDAIGLATCPAGSDGYTSITAANLKRHPANPVLAPHAQGRDDETHVSQGAVYFEQGQWHSLYSYRTAQDVLPGIRLATSPDGIHWTKQPGSDLFSAAPEYRYVEWHQLQKIQAKYVMFFEGYREGIRWGANIATSDQLTTGWRKLPSTLIDQTTWDGYADDTMYHVATPAAYEFNGKWYLYVQAASSGEYGRQHWALWGMECDSLMRELLASTNP